MDARTYLIFWSTAQPLGFNRKTESISVRHTLCRRWHLVQQFQFPLSLTGLGEQDDPLCSHPFGSLLLGRKPEDIGEGDITNARV